MERARFPDIADCTEMVIFMVNLSIPISEWSIAAGNLPGILTYRP
jgi:hypothetical protein